MAAILKSKMAALDWIHANANIGFGVQWTLDFPKMQKITNPHEI